jgi:N-acetyl-anhydromuramyl-L-alanine amidase AmpD
MQIDNKYTLSTECYIPTVQKKDMIVLHFTAGQSGVSAAKWFATRKDCVSTPYVIESDGTVLQLYDPKYWSYHLGIKGTHAQDRRSIGIEIANMGPLRLNNGKLYSWPNNYTQKFCTLDQTDRYVGATYRGFDYYAAYTPAQLQSVAQLVRMLCDQFSIPHVTPDPARREQFDFVYFSQFKGITSHQNFRSDKFDVGPAFDWTIFDLPVSAPEPIEMPVIAPTLPLTQTIKEVSTWQTIAESVKKVFSKSSYRKDS